MTRVLGQFLVFDQFCVWPVLVFGQFLPMRPGFTLPAILGLFWPLRVLWPLLVWPAFGPFAEWLFKFRPGSNRAGQARFDQFWLVKLSFWILLTSFDQSGTGFDWIIIFPVLSVV
jgi:hypothetical protein